LHFLDWNPAEVVGFLADGEVDVAGGAEEVVDVVVQVFRFVFSGGDQVDIEIEDGVFQSFEFIESGFLAGLLEGDCGHVWVAISMAAELQPAIEFAVVGEEGLGACSGKKYKV
jgi:hypothetical protein